MNILVIRPSGILRSYIILELLNSGDILNILFDTTTYTSVYLALHTFVNKKNIFGCKNIAEAYLKHSIPNLVYVETGNSLAFSSTTENPSIENMSFDSLRYGLRHSA